MEPCDPRIYLAAERTFLAWIRTGLALMGFGFLAARFGLFITEEASSGRPPSGHPDFTIPMGIALIVSGVAVNAYAAWRYNRYLRALERGEFRPAFGVAFACLLAGFLALVGASLAVYLTLI